MSAGLARHARALWLAMILLTLGGLASALNLPVSLFPQIDYPRVVVTSGVAAGDLVVTQGGTAVEDGMKVHTR